MNLKSKIYGDLCSENNIYIVLIFRAHSERVPHKINRPFYNNESLLKIKIKQLLEVFPTENIIIAGDTNILLNMDTSDEYNYSNLFDGCKFVDRNVDYMIGNDVPFSVVLDDIYSSIAEKYSGIEHLLITYPTCPLFGPTSYEKVLVDYYVNVIKGEKGFDSIISAIDKRGFFWYNNTTINYEATAKGHSYTQDIKPVIEADNAIWGGVFDKLLKSKYLINDKPWFFKNNKLAGTDIDTMEDFKIAKLLYEYAKKEELL